jgi:hypothetical protein
MGLALRHGQSLLQPISQQAPVGQASQGVVEGQTADLLLGRHALALILQHHQAPFGLQHGTDRNRAAQAVYPLSINVCADTVQADASVASSSH